MSSKCDGFSIAKVYVGWFWRRLTKPDPGALVLIAALSLSLGLLVYILDRAPGSAYLLPGALGYGSTHSKIFGAIGGSLPSFVHAFAFGLLAALAIGNGRRALYLGCGSWWFLGTLFEIGQHRAVRGPLTALLPDWCRHWPVLDHLAAYFLRGTFDPLDLLATAAGAVAAGFVFNIYIAGRVRHESGTPKH